ncbi:NosD domain-containing protein [Bacillus sp. FJAT-27264]|uniref:NosD domain-containing protein n=1 Tax=Paenibacillus sp. (strain DSM 101736 / FJAT-27264) TaxID=1850362 RepID=UPI000AF715AE|nr:NosD domain-containing protein [Bacillus sp. FJAT-27264]
MMKCSHFRTSRQFLVLFLFPLLVAGLLFLLYSQPASADSKSYPPGRSLQDIIDVTQPGDTIDLPPGTYQGPVVIRTRVTLRGGGSATLINTTGNPAITILADGVTLQSINVQHDQDGKTTAIQVKANEVTLEGIAIHTGGYGIMLRDADRAKIIHNRIRWFIPQGQPAGERGNGIDLYNSHGSQIGNNEISYLRDGIYLENSRNTTVDGNRLTYLRYGIHCMYINGSKITNNVGEYNTTGAMVMGVTNVVVSGNSFAKQSRNVHSQGILLYDVRTSSITNNLVEGNRVGIYMEKSAENELRDNVALRNFIGIQLSQAAGNQFHRNGFIANVIDAEAVDSTENVMDGNYWDSFQGLDVDRDGISDIPYAINPFYQRLISRNSAYQLFFQSPGMNFLSDMFAGDKANGSVDQAPLMKLDTKAPLGTVRKDGTVMVAGWLLLFVSVITIIYLGVLRS